MSTQDNEEETNADDTNKKITADAQLGKARETQLESINTQKEIITAQTELNNSIKDLTKSKNDLAAAQIGTVAAPAEATEVTTEADKTMVFAEVLSYEVLQKNAASIADDINKTPGLKKILIVDSLELAVDDVGVNQIKIQLENFKKLFTDHLEECTKLLAKKPVVMLSRMKLEELIKEIPIGNKALEIKSENFRFLSTPGHAIEGLTKSWNAPNLADLGLDLTPVGTFNTALTSASALVSGVSNIMGYFQNQYSISTSKPTSELIALQAEVAGRIKSVPVVLNRFYRVKSSKLLSILQDCLDLRTKVEDAKIKLGLDAAKEPDPKEEETEKPMRELAISSSATMVKTFDNLFNQITAVPTGGDCSPLMIAVLREQYEKLGISHYLYLKIITMGGDVIKNKSIWPWKSDQIAIVAGSVCSVILADDSGNIVLAKTSTPRLSKSRIQFNKIPHDAKSI